MDDSYVIHQDKRFLEELLKDITAIANSIGISINSRKTAILPLNKGFKFLQIKYLLTDTGKIIRKTAPTKVARMRRKMRKLCRKLTLSDFENWYRSWYCSQKKYLTRKQKEGLRTLYTKIMEDVYHANHTR